ncbi:hypothetical protein ACFFK0_05460 [Paenibacillus chartarius]|uniref:Uncharacterized protein n=1 Tax=Paenibacillus chartarius TaxID=747481 RepID=A0ABV6DGZ9_9BACL
MKKKLATILSTIVLSMAFSTSAFAGATTNLAQEKDGYTTPTSFTFKEGEANSFYGIGDWYHGTFSQYEDHDYFYWKNDTGNGRVFYVYFDVNYNGVNNNYLDYGIRSISTTGFGASASKLYDQTGRECWQVYLPAGSELKVDVAPTYYSMVDPNAHYEIDLFNNPKY